MQDLLAAVNEYLEEKFSRRVFPHEFGPAHYCLRGIKPAMWYRVVKPELQRIAATFNCYIEVLIENPKMEWLEFEFVELPAETPAPVKGREPPLTDREIRRLRILLKNTIKTG